MTQDTNKKTEMMVDPSVAADADARLVSIFTRTLERIEDLVEEYDPSTNSWVSVASMPTARSGLAAAVVNGKIYAMGGRSGPSIPSIDTVEVYDPGTNTWSNAAPMPTARNLHRAVAVNGRTRRLAAASEVRVRMVVSGLGIRG